MRPGTAFAGEPLPFALDAAERAGHERTGIRVATRDGAPATVSVPARGRASVELDVPTARRGTRALGRLTLSSDWPLGLWRAWSYVHAPVEGLVWPAPETDAPPLPTGGRGDGGRRARGGDERRRRGPARLRGRGRAVARRVGRARRAARA